MSTEQSKGQEKKKQKHGLSNPLDTQSENSLSEKTQKSDSRDEQIGELTDTLKRLQAEFENFRKRTERDNCEFAKYSNAKLVGKFLPLLDAFDTALKNAGEHPNNQFAKGLIMLHAELLSLLEEEGLRPIESIGKKFDPYLHEVMLKEGSDMEEGTILEEFQKGYMLHDKVLRHSKVKVSGK